MFPLHCRNLPASRDELAQAIESELRRFVHKSGLLVDVRSRAFPYVDEIAIHLDDAEIEGPSTARLAAGSSSKPAFEIGLINLSARNVRFRGMPIDLRLEAQGVSLHQAFDANGHVMLLPQRIENGEILVSAAQTELEKAIARLIAEQARPQRITVEQVQLTLRERGPRSVAGKVRIQARKFLRLNIDLYGQLDIDDNFVATIAQLRCQGAGVIASRACNALDPHLARFNGRSFSLKSLPLGETQLRSLRIAVADAVDLRLGFGNTNVQA